MKYIIILALFLTACQKEQCYTFNVTTTTDMIPKASGYPQVTKIENTQCGLTEKEAKKMEGTSTSTTTVNPQTMQRLVVTQRTVIKK